MARKAVLLAVMALFLSACGSGPGAKIASSKFVDSINAGGVMYTYQGKQIIEITLNFTFDKSLAAGLDPASEDYRKSLYAKLVKGAHFFYAEEELEHTYGYWPSEAGSTYAKEMTLFYVVPAKHAVKDLRFTYDGNVLGEGANGLDTQIKPER